MTTWDFHCRHVKSHHAAVLMNLCVCLIIANVIFVVGVHRTEDEVIETTTTQHAWCHALPQAVSHADHNPQHKCQHLYKRITPHSTDLVICLFFIVNFVSLPGNVSSLDALHCHRSITWPNDVECIWISITKVCVVLASRENVGWQLSIKKLYATYEWLLLLYLLFLAKVITFDKSK